MFTSYIYSSLLFIQLCSSIQNFFNFENRTIEYNDGTTTLRGYLAYNPLFSSVRPAVVVVHDWNGRDEFENGKANDLAQLGYVGFALDLFGAVGKDSTENENLVKPFEESKGLLLRRLQLAMNEVNKLIFVDQAKVASIGFCFGGAAVLEMARNGFNVSGVVSFHGGLQPAKPISNDTIHAKVLVLHGHEDPVTPPQQVQAFEEEMTRKNADWQVYLYGNHTYHAFTVPTANRPPQAQYQPVSAKRSWIAMKNFLFEIFNM